MTIQPPSSVNGYTYTVWVFCIAIHWWRWLYRYWNVWIILKTWASVYQKIMKGSTYNFSLSNPLVITWSRWSPWLPTCGSNVTFQERRRTCTVPQNPHFCSSCGSQNTTEETTMNVTSLPPCCEGGYSSMYVHTYRWCRQCEHRQSILQ